MISQVLNFIEKQTHLIPLGKLLVPLDENFTRHIWEAFLN